MIDVVFDFSFIFIYLFFLYFNWRCSFILYTCLPGGVRAGMVRERGLELKLQLLFFLFLFFDRFVYVLLSNILGAQVSFLRIRMYDYCFIY